MRWQKLKHLFIDTCKLKINKKLGKRQDNTFQTYTVQPLQFVSQFRYLGHIINNEFKDDDDDIKREIHNLFMRTNVLIHRFAKCCAPVKLLLFKTYCLFLYDAALWNVYHASTLDKLNSANNKCIKLFFLYNRRYSVTSMLQEIGLPTFSRAVDSRLDSSLNPCMTRTRRDSDVMTRDSTRLDTRREGLVESVLY